MYQGFRPKYKVALIKDHKKFPYSECIVSPIDLIKHPELPQNGKWSNPKISSDQVYIGAIFTINGIETVYIWKKKNTTKPIHTYKSNQILSFDFAPNVLSFIIIYEDQGPIHYNIANGKVIVSLQSSKFKMSSILAMSFSAQSRYFSIANESYFLVWDVLTGENKIALKDSSPSKFIRNDILVTIAHNGLVKMINMTTSKAIVELKLPSIGTYSDLMSCMLSKDKEEFYFATKDGVYKTNIYQVVIEDVLSFNQTEPTKVFISSDCNKYMTTNYQQINFWEYEKDLTGSIPRQKFNHIAILFNCAIYMVIDDISISVVDYSFPDNQPTFLWTNVNPIQFKSNQYAYYGTVLLTIIDDNNAILWNSISGKIIMKWYNELPHWSISLSMSSISLEDPIIAVKSSEKLIEIWDCNTGIPIIPLIGFNAFNTKISFDGSIILAGTTGGNEIARLWYISDHLNPKKFERGEMNIDTCVDISSDQTFIICHSKEQYPYVFEVESEKMLFECKADISFSQVIEVTISNNMRTFYSKGFKMKEPIAVIWDIDTGKVIKEFRNCSSISFSQDSNYLVTNYSNPIRPTEDKVNIWMIDENANLKCIDLPIASNENYFLMDSKTLASKISEDNLTRFTLTDVNSGELMGEVKYSQIENGYSSLDLAIEENQQKTNIILYKVTMAD